MVIANEKLLITCYVNIMLSDLSSSYLVSILESSETTVMQKNNISTLTCHLFPRTFSITAFNALWNMEPIRSWGKEVFSFLEGDWVFGCACLISSSQLSRSRSPSHSCLTTWSSLLMDVHMINSQHINANLHIWTKMHMPSREVWWLVVMSQITAVSERIVECVDLAKRRRKWREWLGVAHEGNTSMGFCELTWESSNANKENVFQVPNNQLTITGAQHFVCLGLLHSVRLL